MFRLPKKLRVGAYLYQVKEMQRVADEQRFGQIVMTEDVIELHPNLSPTRQKTTLLHEAIHSIMEQAGIPEHDEQIINILSSGFVRLLDDNPGVFA